MRGPPGRSQEVWLHAEVRSTSPRPTVPPAEAHGTVWKPGADPGSYDVPMEKRCPVGPGMEPAAGFHWGAVCFSTRHGGPRRRTPNPGLGPRILTSAQHPRYSAT